jgi:hypothetical protein
MVSTLFCYQLVLLALVCLCLILHARWSSNRHVAYRSLPKSLAPLRKPFKAPKPFAGLTYKPHCAACEQEATSPKSPPAVPPDPMPVSNRCSRRGSATQVMLTT